MSDNNEEKDNLNRGRRNRNRNRNRANQVTDQTDMVDIENIQNQNNNSNSNNNQNNNSDPTIKCKVCTKYKNYGRFLLNEICLDCQRSAQSVNGLFLCHGVCKQKLETEMFNTHVLVGTDWSS